MLGGVNTTGVEIFGTLATIAETPIGLDISKHPVTKVYEHYGKIPAIRAAALTESSKAAIKSVDGGVERAIGGGLLGPAIVGALAPAAASAVAVTALDFAASFVVGAALKKVGAAIGNDIDEGTGDPTENGFEPGSGQPLIGEWQSGWYDQDNALNSNLGSPVSTGGTGYVGDHPGPGPSLGASGSEGGDARREGGSPPSGGGHTNTGNNPGNPNAPGYNGNSSGSTRGGTSGTGLRGSEGGDHRREGDHRGDDRGSTGGDGHHGSPDNAPSGGRPGGGVASGGGYANTGNNPGNPNAGGYYGGGSRLQTQSIY